MGKRGPAKTSKKVLEQRGSKRARRRTPEPKPKPEDDGGPQCPDWILPVGKLVWARLVPSLRAAGVVTAWDENLLTRYCQTFAKWVEAEQFIMAGGGDSIPVDDGKGTVLVVKEPPVVRRAERLGDALLRMERHLGLTPAARADMVLTVADPDENRGGARPRPGGAATQPKVIDLDTFKREAGIK